MRVAKDDKESGLKIKQGTLNISCRIKEKKEENNN